MKFVGKVTLAVLSLALAGSLVACSGGQTDEANAAMDRANGKIEENNARDAEIGDLAEQINALGTSTADSNKGVELSEQTIAKIGETKAGLEAAKAEYEKIAAMDVSEELKTYAEMQLDINAKELELVSITEEIAADQRELFSESAADKLTEAKAGELDKSIGEKAKQSDTVQTEIEELQQKANDYYAENLGG